MLSSKISTYVQTQCFQTVTHSHTNPWISGKSHLYYTYKNEDFKTVTFHMSCSDEKYNSFIVIESVQWLLPASMEDYCPEANGTDYNACSSVHPCYCCEIPEKLCSVDAMHARYISQCNATQDCVIYVQSRFLDNCPGREYDCDKEKCHSRWARLSYSCQPLDQSTAKVTTTTTAEIATTIANTGNMKIVKHFSWGYFFEKIANFLIGIELSQMTTIGEIYKEKCNDVFNKRTHLPYINSAVIF